MVEINLLYPKVSKAWKERTLFDTDKEWNTVYYQREVAADIYRQTHDIDYGRLK